MQENIESTKMDQNLYIFIGHGWNTDQTFDISDKNVRIIMLKTATCLIEDPSNKHLRLLSRVGRDLSETEYMKELYKLGIRFNNEFCAYDSENFPIVPNLLLTTHSKVGEVSRLQKVGDIRPTPLQANVLMLSDLVDQLGGNFTLEVYACRNPLTPFQMENLYVFRKGGEDISDLIMERNIEIISEDSEIKSPPCSEYVGV